MGMSASQGKLLMLTARTHDLEFKAQMLTQRRLSLASQSLEASQQYERATTNREFLFSTKDSGNAPRLTYSNVVNSYQDGGLGYRLKDADGYLIVDKMPDNIDPNSADLYKVIANINDPNVLEAGLRNGAWFLEQPIRQTEDDSSISTRWEKISVAEVASIDDALKTSDDTVAGIKYSITKQQIESQDKALDIEQKALETEHKAVETERESIAKVIMKNVETSYKAFNA